MILRGCGGLLGLRALQINHFWVGSRSVYVGALNPKPFVDVPTLRSPSSGKPKIHHMNCGRNSCQAGDTGDCVGNPDRASRGVMLGVQTIAHIVFHMTLFFHIWLD